MNIHKLSKEDFIRLEYRFNDTNDTYLDYLIEKHSEPVGYSKFKGDNYKLFGDMNLCFNKGNTYPVYWDGEHEFVIGSDGKGYKLTPPASWTKIKQS